MPSIDWKALAESIAPGVSESGLGSVQEFAQFVRSGGRVLMIAPRGKDSALAAIPGVASGEIRTADTSGDFADALQSEPHGYLRANALLGLISSPAFEVSCGSGKLIVSSRILAAIR